MRQPGWTDPGSGVATNGAGETVLARYRELAALVASSADPDGAGWSPGDADDLWRATACIHREARMLDDGRYDQWLEEWVDDAVLWVPLDRHAAPEDDQALYLDDRRRLDDRIRWRRDRSAWAQQPASATVRTVGTVEVWRTRPPDSTRAEGLVVRSSVVIVEQRIGATEIVAGHQLHELVGPDLRRRTKIVLVPALALGVRNPSYLL